jgi:flavin reductase (DIM6/NTAB) family NADH-FMN oxidoreductase RutF
MECRVLQILTLDDLDGRPLDRHVVFGQVVGIHIDDRFIRGGLLDTAAMRPIARCGYNDYAVVEAVFSIVRPESAEAPAPAAARRAAR